jgi:hypothetical protein
MSANDFQYVQRNEKSSKDQMKEEPSFREGFIEEAERVYNL